MLGLEVLFWILVIFFAVIGSIRGWAKELMVTFAAILGIFIITVIELFLPFIEQALTSNSNAAVFWFRSILFMALVFFGYQTPSIPKLAASGRFARDRLQDILLGFVLGGFNGYFVAGTLWFFMDKASYPFAAITAPTSEAALQIIQILPPLWLAAPTIYFAIAIAFAFVLVVFI